MLPPFFEQLQTQFRSTPCFWSASLLYCRRYCIVSESSHYAPNGSVPWCLRFVNNSKHSFAQPHAKDRSSFFSVDQNCVIIFLLRNWQRQKLSKHQQINKRYSFLRSTSLQQSKWTCLNTTESAPWLLQCSWFLAPNSSQLNVSFLMSLHADVSSETEIMQSCIQFFSVGPKNFWQRRLTKMGGKICQS